MIVLVGLIAHDEEGCSESGVRFMLGRGVSPVGSARAGIPGSDRSNQCGVVADRDASQERHKSTSSKISTGAEP